MLQRHSSQGDQTPGQSLVGDQRIDISPLELLQGHRHEVRMGSHGWTNAEAERQM